MLAKVFAVITRQFSELFYAGSEGTRGLNLQANTQQFPAKVTVHYNNLNDPICLNTQHPSIAKEDGKIERDLIDLRNISIRAVFALSRRLMEVDYGVNATSSRDN